MTDWREGLVFELAEMTELPILIWLFLRFLCKQAPFRRNLKALWYLRNHWDPPLTRLLKLIRLNINRKLQLLNPFSLSMFIRGRCKVYRINFIVSIKWVRRERILPALRPAPSLLNKLWLLFRDLRRSNNFIHHYLLLLYLTQILTVSSWWNPLPCPLQRWYALYRIDWVHTITVLVKSFLLLFRLRAG